MLATTHVVCGAVIGRRLRHPGVAVLAAIGSHLVLDAVPHWGVDLTQPGGRRRYLAVAVADGVTLSAALTWIARRFGAGPELAGALGGLLLDLDKPAAELGVHRLWPAPVDRVHVGIQVRERPGRWPVDVTVALAGLCALRRDSRRGAATR